MRNLNCSLTSFAFVSFVTFLVAFSCTNPPPIWSAEANTSETLDMAMAKAAALCQPLVVLVAEAGQSRTDDAALSLFDSLKRNQRTQNLVTYSLNLGISRNRAIAARFHPIRTPLLVSLSQKGVIICRDEKHLSRELMLKRMDEAFQKGPVLDAQLIALQGAVLTNTNCISAEAELADFLLAHRNALEAVPHLEPVAHCETCEDAQRVRAWVALARAHLWIGEPEKARAEAQKLIAALGARLPEARAGAKLILGIHDANLNRPALARQEFEESIRHAPASPYAKEAAEMLTDLRKGWTTK